MYMGVVLYSFARDWALGPHLRGTCARTVAQKLVFVDLGLSSFRVDCAQAFLSSVFVVQTATHKDFSR